MEFLSWAAVIAFVGAVAALCASYLLGGDD